MHLILVKKWCDTVARKRQESLRQKNIISYFAIFSVCLRKVYNYIKFLVMGISELRTVPGPKLPG